MKLTHTDTQGKAAMVDVSGKEISTREASAQAIISMNTETLALVVNNQLKKGDVLSVARIAGIMAAKRCADLIPLCHPLALSKVAVDFDIQHEKSSIVVRSYCKLSGQTGVEMEALTAASIAALTIYDMCKATDRNMVISDTYVLEKKGGRRGHYVRSADAEPIGATDMSREDGKQ